MKSTKPKLSKDSTAIKSNAATAKPVKRKPKDEKAQQPQNAWNGEIV